jgi:hypothetical protein
MDRAEYYHARGVEALRLASWAESVVDRALFEKLALQFQQRAYATALNAELCRQKEDILAIIRRN